MSAARREVEPFGWTPGPFAVAGAAGGVGPFAMRIPADRLGASGPPVQDWLMLIASEDRINPESFTLARLGTPDRRTTRGTAALSGITEHLALRAHDRDVVRAPRAAGDRWTSIVKIVTGGPNGGASCH